ncbi:uncharacterized protein [Miscanthus floridulus]|uniref:uncharacterized protein n=1 Tax=Miscanthus floridulus TaxID=154761 RepID=UPI003459F1E4
MVLTVTTDKQLEEGERAFMDQVLVVDTSGSMGWEGKLDKVKQTLKGIIKGEWQPKVGTTHTATNEWLRTDDRLCIITFDTKAQVVFKMNRMSEDKRNEALDRVSDMRASGDTNMKEGLEVALKEIKERTDRNDYAPAIILLSDGFENTGGSAREVDITRVRVDTIGFGTKHDRKILEDISQKSDEGGYSNSWDHNKLMQAMSSLLDFSKHIVARNLEVTVELPRGVRVSVDSGTNRQETYQRDIQKHYKSSLQGGRTYYFLVAFYLPPAQREGIMETVMTYHWKCRRLIRGKADEASQPGGVPIIIKRTTQGAGLRNHALVVNDVVPKVVRTEETRRNHLAMIKEVRKHADAGNFYKARDTLAVGMGKLDDLQDLTNSDISIKAINFMYAEGEELFRVLESEHTYNNGGGQSYVAACISSHELQRYVARGDEGCQVRLFTTKRMRRYLDDAIQLDSNMAA